MNIPTIAHEWARFNTACVPPDAPEVQHHSMKTAFYAGVVITWSFMTDIVTKMSDENAMQALDAWKAELAAYREEVEQRIPPNVRAAIEILKQTPGGMEMAEQAIRDVNQRTKPKQGE